MKELQNHPQNAKRRQNARLETDMVERGRQRSEGRRDKKLASNTTAGVEERQKLEAAVKQLLEDAMKPYDAQGKGNKPRWYKPFKAVRTDLTASLAVNCFIDAAAKKWSLTKAREQTARTFVALLYEQVVEGNSERRREYQRFKNRMMRQLGDTYRRVDLFHARAKELGFDIEQYQKKSVLQALGAELMNYVMLAGLTHYKKERKEGDKNKTRYLVLSDEIRASLDKRNNQLDLMSPYYSLMSTQPNEWRRHEDGWSKSGAYNSNRLNFTLHVVRHMGAAQKQEIEDRIENGKMEACLSALHTIQNTPYCINPYVVEAIQWVIDNDKSAGLENWPNIKQLETVSYAGKDYIVGERVPDEDWEALQDDDQKKLAKKLRQARASNLAADGNTTNLTRYVNADPEALGEAQRLLTEDELFMPHNWDNRSRVYPVNTMSHHDADYIRAMFLFQNEWEVTEDNVGWLILQMANTYGNKIDKLTGEEKALWVEENEEDIRLCGRDIAASYHIWSGAEEPFQFLAACHEYEKYEDAKAFGEKYSSSLPIAVDASQSGVQHFALSLLDAEDAKRVNLSASDERGDIYEDCLEVAKRLMKEDFAHKQLKLSNDPVTEEDRQALRDVEKQLASDELDDKAKKALRRRWNRSGQRRRLKTEKELEVIQQVWDWSDPDLTKPYGRAVIKRNVMTYCYSSRKFGFAQQLRSDWMDKLSELVRLQRLNEHPFGEDEGFAACTYIADVHERAIEEVVNSAKTGMTFIQKIVRILATYKMEQEEQDVDADAVEDEEEADKKKKTYNTDGIHLRFLTPIGFPFHQHYVKELRGRTEVSFFDRAIEDYRVDFVSFGDEDPNYLWVEKSINASAPNLIHAMDATHLMMTVNDCASQGVTDIMVVHDSFATGIGNMGILSRSLRHNMVELYRDYNLYEDLLMQAKALHPDPDSVNWPKVPDRGNFDIDEVYESLNSFL